MGGWTGARTRLGCSSSPSASDCLKRQLQRVVVRPTRITKATAPDLIAAHGVGPDTASTLLISAGDNPHRLHSESSWAALLGGKSAPNHRPVEAGDDEGPPVAFHFENVHKSGDNELLERLNDLVPSTARRRAAVDTPERVEHVHVEPAGGQLDRGRVERAALAVELEDGCVGLVLERGRSG